MKKTPSTEPEEVNPSAQEKQSSTGDPEDALAGLQADLDRFREIGRAHV